MDFIKNAPKDLLERVERLLGVVDVGLVDLVGKQNEIVLVGELDEILDVLARQALAGGIACKQ